MTPVEAVDLPREAAARKILLLYFYPTTSLLLYYHYTYTIRLCCRALQVPGVTPVDADDLPREAAARGARLLQAAAYAYIYPTPHHTVPYHAI